MDFAQHIGNQGMAYTINNTYDVVPQVPIGIQSISETIRYILGTESSAENLIGSLIDRIKNIRNSVSRGTNWLASTCDDVVEKFDTEYCNIKGKSKIAEGNSLNYILVGNLIAIKSDNGYEAPPDDDKLREHHLGLYKELVEKQL